MPLMIIYLQTTRLTIKQNKHLTTELEYQSKQTENLIFQNHKMENEIKILNKDMLVHDEVEKELAKRSHFCQKVIIKYKQMFKELKEEISDIKTKKDKPNKKTINNSMSNINLNQNDNLT